MSHNISDYDFFLSVSLSLSFIFLFLYESHFIFSTTFNNGLGPFTNHVGRVDVEISIALTKNCGAKHILKYISK